MDSGEYVIVGGMIRGRQEITRCYLKHLGAIDTGLPFRIQWAFLLDNPEGWEPDMIREYLPGQVWFWLIQDKQPPYQHIHGAPIAPHAKRMAGLRNSFCRMAKGSNCIGLVNIDSDIMVPRDLLSRLLEKDAWRAALVDNAIDEFPRGKYYNAFNLGTTAGGTVIPRHEPIDTGAGGTCDCTGAVCYYPKRLLQAAKFEGHFMGEDVGFAIQANSAGYRAEYLPILCDHLMTEKLFTEHIQRCPICASEI